MDRERREKGKAGTGAALTQAGGLSAEDKKEIFKNLVAYNDSRVPITQPGGGCDISRKLCGENGEILGGIIAEVYGWDCAFVEGFWVDESVRGTGAGTRLLKAVEEEARRKGCSLIHLDTFDFQAKDFYLKQGYEIFGCLEGCPSGHRRYYLSKKL